MAAKKMSVAEYVELRRQHKNIITPQAVTKAIRLRHRTPGIIKYEMYGGTYVLYVDLEELNNFLVAIKKPLKLHTTKS